MKSFFFLILVLFVGIAYYRYYLKKNHICNMIFNPQSCIDDLGSGLGVTCDAKDKDVCNKCSDNCGQTSSCNYQCRSDNCSGNWKGFSNGTCD
ncbi:hypothetical protein CPAV1605_1378 [seawater metagenome]|uniref:Uncharacterized protein n=1 Tax=seawater metagenome TaxID=1561972 RepID=A0A5E8CKA4_9ZZZZ